MPADLAIQREIPKLFEDNMGSFNIKCFVTNQIITSGAACRVVPIAQQSTFNAAETVDRDGDTTKLFGVARGLCDINSFWRPQSGFIPCVYDDYGDVKPVLEDITRAHVLTFFGNVLLYCPNVLKHPTRADDTAFDFASFIADEAPGIAALLNARRRICPGPVTVLGPELDKELMRCWDYVWDATKRCRLYIQVHGYTLRPLQFAVMHERTYEALIDRVTAWTDREGNSFEPLAYMTRVLQDAFEYSKEVNSSQADGWAGEIALCDSIRSSLRRLDRGDAYPGGVESHFMRKYVAQLAKKAITEEQFLQACLPLLRDRYAIAGLDEVGAVITPVTVAGQDDTNRAGKAFAALVRTVSAKVNQDRVDPR
jgi:hypothetical protein